MAALYPDNFKRYVAQSQAIYCIPDENVQEIMEIFNKLNKPPLQLIITIKIEKNIILLFAYCFHLAISQPSKAIKNEERNFCGFLISEN